MRVGQPSVARDLRAGLLKRPTAVQIQEHFTQVLLRWRQIREFLCSCRKFPVACCSPGMVSVTSSLFAEAGPGTGEPCSGVCSQGGAQHQAAPAP